MSITLILGVIVTWIVIGIMQKKSDEKIIKGTKDVIIEDDDEWPDSPDPNEPLPDKVDEII
jgi:hypothetical protein